MFFFSFAFVSHCQDRITRGCFYILQNAGDCTILLHFFENFPGGGMPPDPPRTRATVSHVSPGADPGGGGVTPPPALDHQFFLSTNFLTIAKKRRKKNRSEYSMDAMYLNLMFINPRPPSARAAKAPAVHCRRCPPPLQKILDPRLQPIPLFLQKRLAGMDQVP